MRQQNKYAMALPEPLKKKKKRDGSLRLLILGFWYKRIKSMREVWCSFNCELLADIEAFGVKFFAWIPNINLIHSSRSQNV